MGLEEYRVSLHRPSGHGHGHRVGRLLPVIGYLTSRLGKGRESESVPYEIKLYEVFHRIHKDDRC